MLTAVNMRPEQAYMLASAIVLASLRQHIEPFAASRVRWRQAFGLPLTRLRASARGKANKGVDR
jgi:hypothetical protein